MHSQMQRCPALNRHVVFLQELMLLTGLYNVINAITALKSHR